MFLNLIYDNIFFDNLIHMQRVASTSRLGLFLVSSTRFEIIVSYEYAVNMPSGDCVKYVTAVVLGTVPNYWSRIYSRYNCIIHIQTNSIRSRKFEAGYVSKLSRDNFQSYHVATPAERSNGLNKHNSAHRHSTHQHERQQYNGTGLRRGLQQR